MIVCWFLPELSSNWEISTDEISILTLLLLVTRWAGHKVCIFQRPISAISRRIKDCTLWISNSAMPYYSAGGNFLISNCFSTEKVNERLFSFISVHLSTVLEPRLWRFSCGFDLTMWITHVNPKFVSWKFRKVNLQGFSFHECHKNGMNYNTRKDNCISLISENV